MTPWRVGSHIDLNVYEGDRPVCLCHTPEDARRIVDAVNGTLNPRSAASEDLFDALEGLVMQSRKSVRVGHLRAVRNARAALAKARGEISPPASGERTDSKRVPE